MAGGADYLQAVKENQGYLYEDIYCLFDIDAAHGFEKAQHTYAQTVNKELGRLEIRQCWFSENKEYLTLVRKRQNWKIENQAYWVLDVAFQEDDSRVRKDYSVENLAVLRHITLNRLKMKKTAKGGIHAKR